MTEVGGETISERELDVWKAAVIGKVTHDRPKSTEASRRVFRYLLFFFLLALLNTCVMLFLGKVAPVWYVYVAGGFFAAWCITATVSSVYWRQRIRDEHVNVVLRFSLEDLVADNAPEIEFYERTYDVYITPKRRYEAAVRAAAYARRMTRERYDRMKEEIRRERILKLSKMMRSR